MAIGGLPVKQLLIGAPVDILFVVILEAVLSIMGCFVRVSPVADNALDPYFLLQPS